MNAEAVNEIAISEEDFEKYLSIKQWSKTMIDLTMREKKVVRLYPLRGEIWTCALGENVGSEINKTRPCLIVQNNIGNKFSATVIVLPIGHKNKKLPTQVSIGDNDEFFVEIRKTTEGAILGEQIKTISKARLRSKIGMVSDAAMNKVDEAMKISLGISDTVKPSSPIIRFLKAIFLKGRTSLRACIELKTQ